MKPTREDMLRMAKEAGVHVIFDSKFGSSDYFSASASIPTLEAFFSLAYAAGQRDEKEACAKVCDAIGYSDNGYGCAAAIRARNDTIEQRAAEIERLKEQLAACQKDAERYRWLRDTLHTHFKILVSPEREEPTLDASIDAAMKEEPK